MLLDYIVKNVRRQRTRTALTVVGIVIGITTIIALGSLGEGITQYISGALELTAGKIMVTQAGSSGFIGGFAGSDLTQDDMDQLKLLDGVKDVTPMGFIMSGGAGFGPSEVVVGIDPESGQSFVGENIGMHDGRELVGDDTEVAMLGFDKADQDGLEVGDYILIKETEFEIVGIIERTGNSNVDGSVMINIRDVQEMLKTDMYQVLYVIPYNVDDVETIADSIRSEFEGLNAITSKDMARQAGAVTSQIQLYTIGLGAISAVVGGLGIMNTMVMAVLERKKEIGVLKAMGATRRWILQQFLTEAVAISLIGGALGVLAGWGIVTVAGVASNGSLPLKVTPFLIGVGMAFAVSLGVLGGAYPSWKAAKLDPVEAMTQ